MPNLRHTPTLALALALLALMVPFTAAVADEPEPQEFTTPAVEAAVPAPELPPVAQAIADVMTRERAEVDELSARIAATADTQEKLRLQRQVQVVKMKAERAMLALQMDGASGKVAPESLAQLEESIAALDALTKEAESRLAAEVPAIEPQR